MWSLFSSFYVLTHKIVLIGANVFCRSGFFFKVRIKLPAEKIRGIIITSFFKIRRLYFVTAASKTRLRMFSVFTGRRTCLKTVSRIYGVLNAERVYSISFAKTILMCMTWSNLVTGLLIMYPFIRRVELIFGQEYREKMYSQIDISEEITSIGVPGEVAFIAGILILGWFAAVIIQFLRYIHFSVYKNGDVIIIRRGFVFKNCYITRLQSVVSVTVRQSILMSLFHLKSVYINTVGLALLRGDKGLLFITSAKNEGDKMQKFGLCFSGAEIKTLKPVKRAAQSYLYLPFYCCAISAILSVFFGKPVTIILCFFLTVFIIWFLFRIRAYKNIALSFYEKAVEIDYFKRMNLTKTVVSIENIKTVRISQSLIQRFFNTCNIELYMYSTSVQKQIVKHFDYNDAVKIFSYI